MVIPVAVTYGWESTGLFLIGKQAGVSIAANFNPKGENMEMLALIVQRLFYGFFPAGE